MASATVNSKGQITIPLRVREKLGLKPGDSIEFVEVDEARFELMPRKRSIKELEGRYQGKVRTPVTIEEMNVRIARHVSGK